MNRNKFKELRKAQGLTLEFIAEELGTSKQTIHRYENGVISNIPPEKVERLASLLGSTPAELMGWHDAEEEKDETYVKRIPMLGEIACGAPIYANEEHETYVVVSPEINADFCLRAHGDSMERARIYDGDIVFIRAQDTVENGEIAAVIIGDEATLKRVYYYPNDEKLMLMPENPRYEPLLFIGDELGEIKILGKAVAFQSTL